MGKCPHCGKPINQSYAFENRVRRPFKTDALAPTFPQPAGLVQEQPTGLPSMESHVRIPFRQTVIFGLLDAPIGLAIGLGAGLSIGLLVDAASLDSLTPAAYTLITGAGGAIGGTVSFCRAAKAEWPKRLNVYDALLWVEEVTGLDLDGDGEVGEPVSNRVEVEIQEKGIPREIDTIELDEVRLTKFARLIIVDKKSFSGRTAIEAGISREEEWVPFRDKMIGRRWAAWRIPGSPKKGIVLLPKGEAILKALLPPALSGNGVSKNGGTPPTHPPTPSNYQRFEHIEE